MSQALSKDMQIKTSVDLKPYNSLAISAVAEYFCSVNDIDQLRNALIFAHNNNLQITPIGGGSNIIIASDLAGLVLHINLLGVEVISSDTDTIKIRFAAGENWHSMVTYCLDNGWYGLPGGHCVQLIFTKQTLKNGNTTKDCEGGWILVGHDDGGTNSW